MVSRVPESSGPSVQETDLQITSSEARGRLALNENLWLVGVGRPMEYSLGISDVMLMGYACFELQKFNGSD
jgi:hypothetical protein